MKKVYNEALIDRLNKAKAESGVSYEVMAALIGEKKSITYKYLTKKRNMIRSDTERNAVVAEKILLALVANKRLPAEPDNELPRTEQIMEIINDYLEYLG